MGKIPLGAKARDTITGVVAEKAVATDKAKRGGPRQDPVRPSSRP